LAWISKSTTYQANINDGINADTTGGAWTLTLPLSPSVGDLVGVADSGGYFATNNLTVNGNGENIMGDSDDLICDQNNMSFALQYSGATEGWIFYPYIDQGAGVSLSRGYIDGLILSNNVGDSDHDIDISAGICRSDSDDADLSITVGLTKLIDASWEEGSGLGGLDTGSVGNNTWYHIFIIKRTDTGVVDVLFSLSPTDPVMPDNYDCKRRIGSILTDGSSNIIPFYQSGNKFMWTTEVTDINGVAGVTPAALVLITVPTGISVEALCRIALSSATVGDEFYINSPYVSGSIENIVKAQVAAVVNSSPYIAIITNTSAQIYQKATDSDVTCYLYTGGWIDPRGALGGDQGSVSSVLKLPRGYIDGLILSNDSDVDHDIAVSTGVCRNSTNVENIEISALIKQLDANWVVGNNQGGLDTGSVAANTWYHVFAIKRTDTGVTDILFSLSVNAPSLPTNYTVFRRIGSILTDADSNIIGFTQAGESFTWNTAIVDVNAAAGPNVDTLVVVSVPTGIPIQARCRIEITSATVGDEYHLQDAPAVSSYELIAYAQVAGVKNSSGEGLVRTNTSAEITHKATDTDVTVSLITNGWIDSRGSEGAKTGGSTGSDGIDLIYDETFDSDDTWDKSDFINPAEAMVLVECIGGGGSGGRSASGNGAGGGGGGGYNAKQFKLSDLSATESIVIGIGGSAQAGAAAGNSGGNTTFGTTKVIGYGGGGGGIGTTTGGGGGGGGAVAGSAPVGLWGGMGGGGTGGTANATAGGSNGYSSTWGGGGGGGGQDAAVAGGAGGNSQRGGGGGGGCSDTGTGGAGGISYEGGNGGAGGGNGGAPAAGTVPGGGGGGAENQNSGAGANGRCRVRVWG
jgi:hypothetical protein